MTPLNTIINFIKTWLHCLIHPFGLHRMINVKYQSGLSEWFCDCGYNNPDL